MKNQTSSKKGVAITYPNYIERVYKQDLLAYAQEIQLLVIQNIIENQSFISSYKSAIRHDDVSDELEQAIKTISALAVIKSLRLVRSLLARATAINKFNSNIFSRFVKTVAVDSVAVVDDIKLWTLQNARLIKTIPEQLLDKVAEAVRAAVANGDSTKTLAMALEQSFDITKNRANFIARDQVAKLNGNITQARNLGLGLENYFWSSSKDEKVRESHAVLENKVCSWKDATIYKDSIADTKWKKRSSIGAVEKHPCQDPNCRCTSIAVIPFGVFA